MLDENQQARFKTFSTLKMISTGCAMKGAIYAAFSVEHQKFPERKKISSGM